MPPIPVIADEIQAVLGYSPKHKDHLTGAVLGIQPWDVHAYATSIGIKCRECRITDFPNPYKLVYRVEDESENSAETKRVHMEKRLVWARCFEAAILNVGLDPADDIYQYHFGPVVEEAGNEIDMPDFEHMERLQIVQYIADRYQVKIPVSWLKGVMVTRAEEIVRLAEDPAAAEEG